MSTQRSIISTHIIMYKERRIPTSKENMNNLYSLKNNNYGRGGGVKNWAPPKHKIFACWYVHFTSLFCIIIYCYSLIYFIFRYDTYVISSVFTYLMIIGGFAAGVRILLEKGP
jgi:hypothetical protein